MSTRGDTAPIPHAFEVHGEDGFFVSDDAARIDLDVVHGYLTRSYWSTGISRTTVERALSNSLLFGLYGAGGAQVGFARVVTDRATFAYLCDVFILESHQGQGLGRWLMQAVMAHPDLQDLRRFILATRDAHSLYARYGFTPLKSPERFMERHDPDVYRRK
ncbi:GNAT family N-acetyltransferase [Corallococcus carmarthensis]|uniref:GNAT family N-acetyltransferase n=1 Tax=Corallococcus carmarthensis TaxID=2316728 RepID=UPI00148CD7EE|nr:GNAT family N-acetyltransferase [Corallococcus carmarthensis]NOK15859.1 GNAT family N-acetyltransferase [Corallococcus carmarthensis]